MPFTIDVPDAVLEDLQDRLRAARIPDEIREADWDYGTSLSYLRELVEYWRDHFDWRAWVARKATQRIAGVHLVGCEGVLRSAVPLGRPADMESDGFGYVEI